MIDLSEVTHVYFAREPVDFRRQIDGLSLHVQEVLALDPFAPQVFFFRNRRGDKLKALTWHGNGFCLLYKRLERGRFVWPRIEGAVFVCRRRELQWLLEGCDITALPRQKKLTFSRV